SKGLRNFPFAAVGITVGFKISEVVLIDASFRNSRGAADGGGGDDVLISKGAKLPGCYATDNAIVDTLGEAGGREVQQV
ncbi:hypothetical protein PHISCL_10208, partial [Aspergillus sclerotialis]